MKTLLSTAVIAALLLPIAPQPVQAGIMSSACLRSDRKAKSRSLCSCIQQVADQTLSRNDQRVASGFFKTPHKAQQMRQSDRPNHERFWLRYKEFGVIASASCGHLS